MTQIKEPSLTQTIEDHLDKYFKDHEESHPESGLYGRIISEIERVLIKQTLKSVAGNKVKASKILGINRNTLRKKILELGL